MRQLELKESFGAEAIETARAFANAHGGFIVIGVSGDRNRRVLPKGVKAWSGVIEDGVALKVKDGGRVG